MSNNSDVQIHLVDGRHRYPPSVHWIELREGFPTAVFRDSRLKVIEGFTQYAIAKSETFWNEGKHGQAYISAIEALVYSLGSLSKFLSTRDLHWWNLNDELLVAYRTYANNAIAKSGKQKDELSSQRTVNVGLRQIYHALVWLQEDALMINGMVGGNDSAVQSSLARIFKGERYEKEKETEKFPCLFRRVGEGSRMRGSVHWATEEDCDDLEEYFSRKYEPDLAERNILLMYLMDQVGIRRGSAGSLAASQFIGALDSGNPAQTAKGYVIIPPKQKNSRQESVELEYALVAAVIRYIEGSRAKIVAETGSLSDALFLSEKGTPLTLKAMTKIFRNGMTAIGVTAHSAAMHCFRRKSGNDAATNSIAARKSAGLPVGPLEVMADTAAHLTQGRYLSAQSYVRSSKAMVDESREAELQRELRTKDLEVARLRLELERAKAGTLGHSQGQPTGFATSAAKKRYRGRGA